MIATGQFTIYAIYDGQDGKDGQDGISIVWKGELSAAPESPQENWVYKNTKNGTVYIYNGTEWQLMTRDGDDGTAGAAGADGNSVYITYNDNISKPETPTGDGTADGWHTDVTDDIVWMSQKIASSADTGTWGNPIKIKGDDGTSVKILGSYDTIEALRAAHSTDNEIGDGYLIDGILYVWSGTDFISAGRIKGDTGQAGTSSYLHIKYSNDGGISFTADDGETPGLYIGIYVDSNETDSTDINSYKWTKWIGNDGSDGEAGVSITNMVVEYNTSTDKTTAPTDGWSTEVPEWSMGNYLWIRTKVTYSSGTVEYISTYCDTTWEAINDIEIDAGRIVSGTVKTAVLTASVIQAINTSTENAVIDNAKIGDLSADKIVSGVISGEHLDITGLATFSSLSDDLKNSFIHDEDAGTTFINGGHIKSKTITAESIDLLSGLTVLGEDGKPAFAIAKSETVEGAATVSVNGTLISSNFDDVNNTGYRLTSDGIAILNQAIIRGDVVLPNAGMTNYTDETTPENSTRIWAGSDYNNRNNAPFKVTQRGNVYATNAIIKGTLFGSLDTGILTADNGILTIGGTSKQLDSTTGEISDEDGGDVKIKLSDTEAYFNDIDIRFCNGGYSDITYSCSEKKLDALGVFVELNADEGRTNVTYNPEDTTYGGLNFIGKDNGGHHVVNYTDADGWEGTLQIDCEGIKNEEHGDFQFMRKDNSEDVKVVVSGDLEVKNKISSSKNGIEMRATSDGWGFYVVG